MKQGHPEVTKRATAGVRTLDVDARSFDVVASTDALDSHGEKLAQDWNLQRYQANPVVFFGHESWDLPIGKASDVRVENGELVARVTLVSAAANPRAEQVFNLMKEGALSGVSVGFRSGKLERKEVDGKSVPVRSQNELLEISVVGVPANPEARAKAEADRVAAAEDESMALSDALGLKDASNDKIVERLEREVDRLLDCTGAKTLGDVSGKFEALKAQLEAHAEKSARVEALEAEIAALKATAAEAEIDAIVAAAVEARKLTPAKRDEFAAKAKAHGAEWTRSLIDALPVVVGATPPPKPAETKAEHDLTPRQAAIAASLGIDPKDYAAQLAARTKKAG